MTVTSIKAFEHIWFPYIAKCWPFWDTGQIYNKDWETNDYYDNIILILLVWTSENLYVEWSLSWHHSH